MSDEENEEFTEQEELSIETAMAEIKIVGPVQLDDLLTWVATNDEYGVGEFTDLLGIVYSYSRARNPSIDSTTEEE